MTPPHQQQKVDVLICGGGSAGLCTGIWLARCGIDFKILERRPGPLKEGQADGVQTRTVEIFESFGMSEDLLKEAYHVLELAFWSCSSADHGDEDGKRGGIKRMHCAPDLEPGLSHQPHVILNQARMNALMTKEMASAAGREDVVAYGWEVKGLEVDGDESGNHDAYCVSVTTAKENGDEQMYKAKYVLGCDGAHSQVRHSLGFRMMGDSTDAIWGVMDVYPRTNFPDIRKKAIINSSAGNLLIIPREGDCLVRFYIELSGSALESKNVSLEDLQEQARLIFHPYTMEIAETAWWSAYSIGQRRADFFTRDHRVFLTGDACHTHSPKAGQGMNVSLADGYNIGWKLAAVLQGQATPALLETYVSERQKTATELIEFDRYFTRLFSSKYREENGIKPEHFAEQIVKAGRYTAGQATKYEDSVITSALTSDISLATGLTVGMRFPSVQVVRFCDAKAMQLIRALPADSRWHLIIFAGDIRQSACLARLNELSKALETVIDNFTPPGQDRDSVINPLLILSGKRIEIQQEQIPSVFTPITSKWRMKCLFKTFVDDESYNSGHGHAYETYGVDPSRGAMVTVRPDHYVAKICSLEDCASVGQFFGAFLRRER